MEQPKPRNRPAETVRDLLRRAETAALATTLQRGGSQAPYASLVLLACDHAGAPLLLLSDLADHSKNIAADPRVSLLVDGHRPEEEPLTGARASLQGRAAVVRDQALLDRFVARHPSAATYAGFGDFHLYRVEPEAAHLVAGFGQIHWLDAEDLGLDAEDLGLDAEDLGLDAEDLGPGSALAAAEGGIVAHMNEDHADALDLIAGRILGLDGEDWRLTGVDPEGFDLRRGRSLARGSFQKPVHDAESCRVELVRLTKAARRQAG